MAYVRLSLGASALNEQRDELSGVVDEVRAKIKNPRLAKLSSAAAFFFADFPASEISPLLHDFDTRTMLFLVSQWLSANRKRPDTAEVITYALDRALRDTDYVLKARDLREIATPLPWITSEEVRIGLISRIDSLLGSIGGFDASEEVIRLRLTLAEAISKSDPGGAESRLMETYWYIGTVPDLSVRASCLAWMIGQIRSVITSDEFRNKERLSEVLLDDLAVINNELLFSTADHYYVVASSITALARTRADIALSSAASLNTVERRNQAFSDLASSAIFPPTDYSDLATVNSCLDAIDGDHIRQNVMSKVLAKLARLGARLDTSQYPFMLNLLDRIPLIPSANVRSLCTARAIVILTKVDQTKFARLIEKQVGLLKESWESVEPSWQKTETALEITNILATDFRELAEKYLALSEDAEKESLISSKEVYLTCFYNLRLVSRVFSALVRSGGGSESDIDRLERLVNNLSAPGDQAKLWSEVALRLYSNGKSERADYIVQKYVKPLIALLPEGDQTSKSHVILLCASTLYKWNQTIAIEELNKLPRYWRDRSVISICHFLITNHPMYEPFNPGAKHGAECKYETAVEVLKLLEYIETDDDIVEVLEQLIDAVTMGGRNMQERFNRQQKADLSQRIITLAEKKLPDSRNIKHAGYLVCAKVLAMRIDPGAKSLTNWESLLAQAKVIPNLADRAYTLVFLADSMPAGLRTEKLSLLQEGAELSRKIPIDIDRISRLVQTADVYLKLDQRMARSLLTEAMNLTASAKQNEPLERQQRRIVDVAYQIDPDFASSLVEKLDDDPARAGSKVALKEEIQLQELKKSLMDTNESKFRASDIDRSALPEAAWRNLGSLNAGRIKLLQSTDMLPFVKAASNLTAHDAFPIVSWYIENSARRRGQSSEEMRNLFDSVVLASELTFRLAEKVSSDHLRVQRHAQSFTNLSDGTSSNSYILGWGDEGKALDVIKDWLDRENPRHLRICDPFFGPKNLLILQDIASIVPGCQITILTSRKHLLDEKVVEPYDESFREAWNHLSDDIPPQVEIVIASLGNSKASPVHDRWWVGDKTGLKLGTSLNSIGHGRLSDVTLMEELEAREKAAQLDPLISRRLRHMDDQEIRYLSITL